MSDELVITVAPCGAETTREHNPAVPFTPAEVAAEARRSFEAGARVIRHLPVVMTAIAAGGHVRLGFEDKVEYEPGRPATSNAELVERAPRLGELAGRPIATPERAREILRLAA